MAELQVVEVKKHLRELVGDTSYHYLVNKILNSRKTDANGVTTFGEVEHGCDAGKLKISVKVIDVSDITKNGKGSCKHCGWGKGYTVIYIPKSKLPDPRGYMVLDTDLPEGCTEEQKKEWTAAKNKETTWKIVKICDCAIKESLKKNPNLIVDSKGSVFVEADYVLEQK